MNKIKLHRTTDGYITEDKKYKILKDIDCYHVYCLTPDGESSLLKRFCETINDARDEILSHKDIQSTINKIKKPIESIDDIEREIKAVYKRRCLLPTEDKIRLGKLFCLAKPVIYKNFKIWIESKFGMSHRMAQNYMNFYRSAGQGYQSSGAFKNTMFYSREKMNVVYFIQAELGGAYIGPIKIGYTQKLRNRLISMKMDNFHELKILKIIEGDRNKEKEIHQKFAGIRIKGEWFKPDQSLLSYVSFIEEPKKYNLLKKECIDVVNIFDEPTFKNKL